MPALKHGIHQHGISSLLGMVMEPPCYVTISFVVSMKGPSELG